MSVPLLPTKVLSPRTVSDEDLAERMVLALDQPDLEKKGLTMYPSYIWMHQMEKEMDEQNLPFIKYDMGKTTQGVYLFRRDMRLYAIDVNEDGEVESWLDVGSSRHAGTEGK
jgi:hypothetical protein